MKPNQPPSEASSVSSFADPGSTHFRDTPIPLAVDSPGARATAKRYESAGNPSGRVLGPSESISGFLAGFVPRNHLDMAVADFKVKFPDASDPSKVEQTAFAEWVEDLPIADV